MYIRVYKRIDESPMIIRCFANSESNKVLSLSLFLPPSLFLYR